MAKVRMNAIAFGTFAGLGGIYHFNPKSEDPAARFPIVDDADVAQAKSRGLGEDLSDRALASFKLKEDATSFEALWEVAMQRQLEAEEEAGIPQAQTVTTTALNHVTEIAFPAGDKAYAGAAGQSLAEPAHLVANEDGTAKMPNVSVESLSVGGDGKGVGTSDDEASRIADLNVADLGSTVSTMDDADLLGRVLTIENAKTNPRVTAVNAITARMEELAKADPDAPPVS